MNAQTQRAEPVFVVVSLTCDSHWVDHSLVQGFRFLGLAPGNSVKVDIFSNLNDFTANEQVLLLAIRKLRHLPRLFRPFSHPSFDKLLELVGWALLLLFVLRGVLVSEDDLEQETKEQSGVFLVREQKHIEAQVIKVAQMFEVFGELLAGLKASSGLVKILGLQILDVNELVFLTEHGMDARKAKLGCAAHGHFVEVLNAFHVNAQTF